MSFNRKALNLFLACILTIVVCFIPSANKCLAQIVSQANNSIEITLPAGTILRVILQHKISTAYNNLGDKIETIIPSEMRISNNARIPESSRIIGKIIKLERAQLGLNGYFMITFDTLSIPDKKDQEILAHIWTKKGNGIVGGGQTERIGYKRIPHRIQGIGTVIQLVPYGPRRMGKDAEFLPGTEWTLVLDKDLKLSIDNNYDY